METFELKRYKAHRKSARERGIPFLLTFKQWWTVDDVRAIKNSKERNCFWVRKLGVSSSIISEIRSGKRWKHVTA